MTGVQSLASKHRFPLSDFPLAQATILIRLDKCNRTEISLELKKPLAYRWFGIKNGIAVHPQSRF